MQDRISQHPGRIKLVPVDLNNGIYDVVRADEPTQEGTPLNAANLFSGIAASAITNCSIHRKNAIIETPSNPNEGFQALCEYIGAVDYSNDVTWDIYDLNSGNGIFTNTCVKYLKLLNAVFISVTFKFSSSAASEASPTITIEAIDQETHDILAGCATKVPMLSSIASSNPGPYMEYVTSYGGVLSNGGIMIHTNTRNSVSSSTPEITLVGMYHMFE